MPSRSVANAAQLERLMPLVVDRLPLIMDEVAKLLAESWPDYATFLAGEHIEVTHAAEAFLRWLVATAEHGLTQSPSDRAAAPESADQIAMFEEFGRKQWQEGRELSTLLSAYQVGARVAWHHVSAIAVDLRIEPEALAALAEAVFAFVDQLTSASARGFVKAQSEAAVTRERLRNELVELLLSDRSESAAVRSAARRAGWPLPREAAVILIDPDNPTGQSLLSHLDGSCLPIRIGHLFGAIVPDPQAPGERQRLARALSGATAVVGHPVPLEQLPASARIAEIAARLQRDGLLAGDPVFAADHLDAVIVHRDATLLEVLQRQCLAPLDGLSPSVRERLEVTLGTWLRHLGDRATTAAALHIHPQTVRYRLAQLRALFGEALDDPATRARLTLALAWGRAVTRVPVPDDPSPDRRPRRNA